MFALIGRVVTLLGVGVGGYAYTKHQKSGNQQSSSSTPQQSFASTIIKELASKPPAQPIHIDVNPSSSNGDWTKTFVVAGTSLTAVLYLYYKKDKILSFKIDEIKKFQAKTKDVILGSIGKSTSQVTKTLKEEVNTVNNSLKNQDKKINDIQYTTDDISIKTQNNTSQLYNLNDNVKNMEQNIIQDNGMKYEGIQNSLQYLSKQNMLVMGLVHQVNKNQQMNNNMIEYRNTNNNDRMLQNVNNMSTDNLLNNMNHIQNQVFNNSMPSSVGRLQASKSITSTSSVINKQTYSIYRQPLSKSLQGSRSNSPTNSISINSKNKNWLDKFGV